MDIGHLIEAVIIDDTAEVKKILEAGVDPNQYEDHAQLRPIHFAALYNALNAVPLLVAAGADVSAESHEGVTALDIAKQHVYHEMVRLLETMGPDELGM